MNILKEETFFELERTDPNFLFFEVIELSESVMQLTHSYAVEEQIKRENYYKLRNQNNCKSIVEQIATGKRGEVAVYYLLKKYKINNTKPDFNIYPSHKKSFIADLTCILNSKVYKVHVKTQNLNQSKVYKLSWVFQYGGISGSKDLGIFNKNKIDDDLISFCQIKDNFVKVFTLMPVKILLDNNMFDDASKPELRSEKKVIYYSKLLDSFKINLWAIDFLNYENEKDEIFEEYFPFHQITKKQNFEKISIYEDNSIKDFYDI